MSGLTVAWIAVVIYWAVLLRWFAKRAWFSFSEDLTRAIEASGFVNEDLTYWDPMRQAGRVMSEFMQNIVNQFNLFAQGFTDAGEISEQSAERIQAIVRACAEGEGAEELQAIHNSQGH